MGNRSVAVQAELSQRFADDIAAADNHGVLAGQYTVSGLQPGLQVVRVPISREVNAWYWQWTVENSAGSFFVLHSVKALPVILHPGHQ